MVLITKVYLILKYCINTPTNLHIDKKRTATHFGKRYIDVTGKISELYTNTLYKPTYLQPTFKCNCIKFVSRQTLHSAGIGTKPKYQ